MSGIHLPSHAVTRIVLSAVKVLTVVFGMGTGVSPSRIDTGQFYLFSSFSLLPQFIDSQIETQPLLFLRKEVIQPHLPIQLPCYDFTPVIRPAFDCCFLAVSSQASGISNSHGVTGGVYKTRERIHRSMLICDY